jgi:hypothetical protein
MPTTTLWSMSTTVELLCRIEGAEATKEMIPAM